MTVRSMTLLALAVLLATGCQTTNMSVLNKMPWSKSTEEAAPVEEKDSLAEMPRSMVCVWKDGVLQVGPKPTRGLAGRVYFHNSEEEPVTVDGTFTVYAYQSDGILGPSKVQPDRKFVFESDKLSTHHSVSDIGDSYSFWLPWDAVGGDETSVTLVPILRTSDGRIVRGEETMAIIPGRKRNQIDSSIQELRQEMDKTRNQQVLYESEDFDSHQERQKLMRTHSITVPNDAEAILQAMQQRQQAERIAATTEGDTSRVKTADAVIEDPAPATRKLPQSSDEAWKQTLDAFRSRGAATNQRMAPQNIQRY